MTTDAQKTINMLERIAKALEQLVKNTAPPATPPKPHVAHFGSDGSDV